MPLRREEGDFGDVTWFAYCGDRVIDSGIFSFQRIERDGDLEVRVVVLNADCVITLIHMRNFKVCGFDDGFIRQSQEKQRLRRQLALSMGIFDDRCGLRIIKRDGNIIVIQLVVSGKCAVGHQQGEDRYLEHIFHQLQVLFV